MTGSVAVTLIAIVLVLVAVVLVAVVQLIRRTQYVLGSAPAASSAPDSNDDVEQGAAERAALTVELDQTRARAESAARELLRAARANAETQAADLLLATRRGAQAEADRLTEAARVHAGDVTRRELRLIEREDRVDAEDKLARQRAVALSTAEHLVAERQAELEARGDEHQAELERVAGLTSADAKVEMLAGLETQLKRESALLIRDLEARARDQGEARARHIVVEAIARVASEQTSENVVSVIALPSDEMKGRIIGREGRNIRTFESVTGVNVIIDDTPEAVLLSCFDPIRREVGRLTLESLVADGRIHPHRIEEVYERSKGEITALCQRAGEDAVLQVGIGEVHPELVAALGRLRYRTSYGQNVLKHLVETAHIAGLMAAELKMDPRIVKRAAFLHDIGKSLTHEVEGSHAIVGAELARRYGESAEVVHAIEAHHNEVAPETVEAVLTQASDSCSGGRPGARRESLENYVKRLERIEQIASSRPGVDKVFAMQAGREIRVMVSPDEVDDIAAHVLAREVAKQIEDELTYPGQIRVTVVRETRTTEIAH